MTSKVKSTKLTAIVMARIDELRKGAADLRATSEKAFQQAQLQSQSLIATAKTASHSAKIQANRMEREAEMMQEALDEEAMLQVKEQQAADLAWEQRSEAHLRAELETPVSTDLIELIKKVN